MPRTNGGFIGVPRYPDAKNGPGTWNSDDVFLSLANRKRSSYPAYDSWPMGPDPNFANVTLLCHCNKPGSAARTCVVDSTVGSTGEAQRPSSGLTGIETGLTSNSAKWGLISVYASGKTGQGFFFAPLGTDATFGTGDFTIELWFNQPQSNANQNIMDPRSSASQVIPLLLLGASNNLSYFVNGSTVITGSTTVTQNTWHYIALSRVSSQTRIYLDGTQEGSTWADTSNYISNANWYFGGQNISGVLGPGAAFYLQDVRFTKGVGRYSGTTHTVPTAPHPDYGP